MKTLCPKNPLDKSSAFTAQERKECLAVCVGLAEYFEVDPAIVRLIWILLIFFSMGGAILAYLIAWVIIPERPVR